MKKKIDALVAKSGNTVFFSFRLPRTPAVSSAS
jgi:hypothetical protein